MKTYIITEKDIERLRYNLDCNGDNDWWYISQLDNWEETLNYLDKSKAYTTIAPKVNPDNYK